MVLKFKRRARSLLLILLCAATVLSSTAYGVCAAEAETERKSYIRWMTFPIPEAALRKAMEIDIASHPAGPQIRWVDLLAYLGAKYGGNWKKYRAADMDALLSRLKSGENMAELTKKLKYYLFFSETYGAVLDNFIGDYQIETEQNGQKTLQTRYGLKAFSPIAKGYSYSHYRDFGDSRSFGFQRPHQGNDLLGSIGTPVTAVESGTVEAIGWNRYGGWRIGIRSFDRKRSYYYAHLRKKHPYAGGLTLGSIVKAGDVIGYLGMTGYSNKEGANNMKMPHLHFGMQVIFDESQKEGVNQIWIDVYDIVDLLAQNRVQVRRDDATKDYFRVYDFMDLRYRDHFAPQQAAPSAPPAPGGASGGAPAS